jgi:predicted membrane-bound mannosyltransferase
MSFALVFAAGTLAGAIAVSFVSFGHPGPRVERVERPASRTPAPVRAVESKEPNNETGCDVQLD